MLTQLVAVNDCAKGLKTDKLSFLTIPKYQLVIKSI